MKEEWVKRVTEMQNTPKRMITQTEKDGRCPLCGRTHRFSSKSNRCYYCGQILVR